MCIKSVVETWDVDINYYEHTKADCRLWFQVKELEQLINLRVLIFIFFLMKTERIELKYSSGDFVPFMFLIHV